MQVLLNFKEKGIFCSVAVIIIFFYIILKEMVIENFHLYFQLCRNQNNFSANQVLHLCITFCNNELFPINSGFS